MTSPECLALLDPLEQNVEMMATDENLNVETMATDENPDVEMMATNENPDAEKMATDEMMATDGNMFPLPVSEDSDSRSELLPEKEITANEKANEKTSIDPKDSTSEYDSPLCSPVEATSPMQPSTMYYTPASEVEKLVTILYERRNTCSSSYATAKDEKSLSFQSLTN